MCGIAGIFLKKPALEPELGSMLAKMMSVLSDRGPDSAGFAVYGNGRDGRIKMTLRLLDGADPVDQLEKQFGSLIPLRRSNHVILSVPEQHFPRLNAAIGQLGAGVEIVGSGARMELYKEVGLPSAVAERFDLAGMSGTHAVGHTRMATELAVTTKGAHPFSTGLDQCLVHNGSLSNHNAVRRELEARRSVVCDRQRFRSRRRLSDLAHERRRHAEGGADAQSQRPRRFLYVRRRNRNSALRCCAIRSRASLP